MIVTEILEALHLNCTRDMAHREIPMRVVTHLQHHQIIVFDVLGQPTLRMTAFQVEEGVRLIVAKA